MIYTIKLDQAGIVLMGEALSNLPHKQVAGLIGNLQAQINQQEAAARAEAARVAAKEAGDAAVARAADGVVAGREGQARVGQSQDPRRQGEDLNPA